jgi:hypothetical protein
MRLRLLLLALAIINMILLGACAQAPTPPTSPSVVDTSSPAPVTSNITPQTSPEEKWVRFWGGKTFSNPESDFTYESSNSGKWIESNYPIDPFYIKQSDKSELWIELAGDFTPGQADQNVGIAIAVDGRLYRNLALHTSSLHIITGWIFTIIGGLPAGPHTFHAYIQAFPGWATLRTSTSTHMTLRELEMPY